MPLPGGIRENAGKNKRVFERRKKGFGKGVKNTKRN